jgi:TolB-like protein
MNAPRKLAAILAADIAGFSRLMGLDEAGTAKALREHREAIDPILAGHGGRVFKTTGDGVLVEFPSIVAAVECAVAVQKLMAERNADVPEDGRMLFRMGINLGDVLIEGEDILGDGVNVAARLEAIAQPGSISISDAAYQQVRDKLNMNFEDAGEHQLKNISRPVRMYRVRLDRSFAQVKPALPLPDKPSIAVLPFQNMSGDPEQEYFADGVVEEIITALTRFRQLFVIARNSTFTYKGRAVDVKQVGRELGVRYVLEGSVRKVANRVRITGQLIDASSGAHLWADRFEGALEDIFDLQDRVTESVVGAIAPKLEQVEIERARRKPTESLDAYDYYLRGMASFHQTSQASISEALDLFYKAIEFDADYAAAYGMAAWCYNRRKSSRWVTDPVKETSETERLARRAVELGREDAVALCAAGHALAYVVGDLEQGATFLDRAVALNPNLSIALSLNGWARLWLGELDTAIDLQARAMRVSPRDPQIFLMESATALAHLCAGRYDEASSWARRAFSDQPNYIASLAASAASDAYTGRLEEARKAIGCIRQLDPTLCISNLKTWTPLRRPEHFGRWAEGLRKAGLPE